MRFVKLFVLLVLMAALSNAQTLSKTISSISIIGTKQIANKVLLVSKVDKNTVKLTAIDTSANVAWEQNISIPSLSGYNFNKWQIIDNKENACIVQQTPKTIYYTTLNIASGEIIETGEAKRKVASAENNTWILDRNTPKMYSTQDGNLLEHFFENKKLNTNRVSVVHPKYPTDKYATHFTRDNEVFATSRVLEPNHGLMHLYLQKYNSETKDTMQREIELELAHTSFTYNSSVDKNVYGVVSSTTGFYLIGKLDIAFKNEYPTQKVGDNCIGFWIAKFNTDLSLDYFSEIPFQYLDHIVDADVVQIPSVIDVKEDANGGLFINVNEQQGVLYHKKYFVYLNAKGEINMAKGGQDAYHFMEYDRTGLRNAGRKSKLRLMNDDWSPYATNTFLYLTPKTEYSDEANMLMVINENEKKAVLAAKAYNFYVLSGSALFFEYFEKGKGILNIYTQ